MRRKMRDQMPNNSSSIFKRREEWVWEKVMLENILYNNNNMRKLSYIS